MQPTSREGEGTMALGETKEKRLFDVKSSPHVSSSLTTPRVMIDVLIALLPATVAALFLFRGDAALVMISCVAGAAAAEAFANKLTGRPNSLGDWSAVVTGLILAFCLPPQFPFYFAFLGGAVSTGIGKMVFGGLGANIFNPAMMGRAFLTACFGTMMTSWTEPQTLLAVGSVEAVTQATPLGIAKEILKAGGDPQKVRALADLLPKMFVGTTAGSIGETSGLAILLGGGWMLLRRTITWHIPLGVLLGALLFAVPAWLISPETIVNPLVHLLGGAMLFGAFIIATDPVTCPLSPLGRFLFGVGVGLLTMLIRVVGGYPEGFMYAILLMNSITPFMDNWFTTSPLGLKGGADV